MRSTNIVIFLIGLNAAAGLIGAIGLGAAVGYDPLVGGGEEIDRADESAGNIATDRSALDQFVGGVIEAGQQLVRIFSIAVAGPRMLINLGAPTALVTALAAPLYLLVAIDILEVISGRQLT